MTDISSSKIYISEDKIQNRVKEIGKQITVDYKDKTPTLICVLRGASLFYADLVREIDLPVKLDFIAVSSYGNKTSSSGEIRLDKDVTDSMEGKDIILIEDIIDSGNSMKYIKDLFWQRKPNSIKVCAFLDKPSRRVVDFHADYIGYVVPDEFLVGYGLDYSQNYRNLKDVYILDPSVYGGKK